MERRIDLSNLDLDVAARAVSCRADRWRSVGLTVGELTWMDNEVGWPRPLTGRDAAARPMSVGIRVRRSDGAEGEFVLYAGGWADFGVLLPGEDPEVIESYVEIDSADEFGSIVDRHFARLVDNRAQNP